MGTTADKLNKILESKAAIKAAIEAKGVSDVGDVLANYPDKIASIPSGGSTGFTGHADVEGLKAIGWTDEDIEYYQKNGVNWNEEDDKYHKVPQDNIDLYGVLTLDNILEYKDRIVYLPKLDMGNVNSLENKLNQMKSLIAIPILNTDNITNMYNLLSYCYSLTSISLLNTENVTRMDYIFSTCYSLIYISHLNTSNVSSMERMFYNCHSLQYVVLDVGNVSNIRNIFTDCYSLQYANLKGLKISLSLSSTSLLQKESLLYIIDNAAPTSPITITLSAYCYNKYNADEDVVAALAKQPNISLASA